MEQDVIIMQEIFRFKQLGVDQNGRAFGQFEATGVRPTFVNRLESKGVKLPSNMFTGAACCCETSRPQSAAPVRSRPGVSD